MLASKYGEGYSFDTACEGKNLIIRVKPEAKELIEAMKDAYEEDGSESIVMFDLKHASTEQKIEALRYGFATPSLNDPLMQLNMYNLVKSYNNMNDEFFASSDVYFNSVEEILDVKLALSKEIKGFIRQLSIYFMSLFKSYNKFMFTPSDEHVELPYLYRNMILSSDIVTLSGIFAKSPEFSTNELVYIDNAYVYLTALISRCQAGLSMMGDFIQGLEEKEEVSE